MIFEGIYVHQRVEAPVATWDWYWRNHGYWDGPCVCADCTLMDQDMVSSPGVFALISFQSMYDADYDY